MLTLERVRKGKENKRAVKDLPGGEAASLEVLGGEQVSGGVGQGLDNRRILVLVHQIWLPYLIFLPYFLLILSLLLLNPFRSFLLLLLLLKYHHRNR